MNCLKIVFKILLIFVTVVSCKRLTESQKKSQEATKKCREAENAQIHPLDCCKYPRFFDNTPRNLKDCDVNCRMLPYPLFSCVRNCIIERYGVFTRGNGGFLGPNRITEAFCDQDEVPGIRQLQPIWRQVVYNASLACYTEFPLTPGSTRQRNVSSEDSWNYYYMNYVECIRKRNFLQCNLMDNPGCKKLRESIIHCHLPDYEFLHKLFFEDFYYRNKTEEARLKKLKEENKPDLYKESHKNDVTLPSPKDLDSSTTSDNVSENKSDVDTESTQSSGDTTNANDKRTQIQNEGSVTKNVEDNGSSSQDPGVTGAT